MASSIDATKPADGVPASKADLRANLSAAKSEIEALQTQAIPAGGTPGLVLTKASGADYETAWQPVPGGTGWPPADVIRPEDYGADPSVLATDNAGCKANWDAIKAMFEAATASTPKVIWFRPGATYYTQPVTSMAVDGSNYTQMTISGKSNFIVYGNGATIAHSDNVVLGNFIATFIELTGCNDFTFIDLVLDGRRDSISHPSNSEFGHGWLLRNCKRFRWDRCTAKNTRGDGWEVTSTYSGTKTPALFCEYGTWWSCLADNNTRQGWSIEHLYYGALVGCWAVNTNGKAPESGIDVEPFTSIVEGTNEVICVKGLQIIGCTMANNAGGGFYSTIAGAAFDDIRVGDVLVSGCMIEDNGQATNPVMILDGEVTFVNNVIRGHNTTGGVGGSSAVIRFISSANSQYNCIIANNRIVDNDGMDNVIWTASDVDTGRILIHDNIIEYKKASRPMINISGNRFIVRDNHFVGNGTQTAVSISSDATACAVVNNTYENVGTMISDSGTNTVISPASNGGWVL